MSESYKAEGTITHIGDTEQKSATFSVRQVVLTIKDGEYENLAVFQFTGDKTSLLDGYSVGDGARVSFNIRGREWGDKYFCNLTGWKIEKTGSTQVTPSAAPANANFDDETIPF